MSRPEIASRDSIQVSKDLMMLYLSLWSLEQVLDCSAILVKDEKSVSCDSQAVRVFQISKSRLVSSRLKRLSFKTTT